MKHRTSSLYYLDVPPNQPLELVERQNQKYNTPQKNLSKIVNRLYTKAEKGRGLYQTIVRS